MNDGVELHAKAAMGTSFDQWIEVGRATIADIVEGLNLRVATRVYADFYAPRATAKGFAAEIERHGWRVLFFPAEPYETAFIHTRQEKIWSLDELRQLTPELYRLSARFGAAYDGWFVISVDEDEADSGG